jgi:PTS system mannose-specific IIB component
VDFVLIRVDNRLVHGQILEAWVPAVKASCIVVVDDEVSGDFFRETVIKMAVPRDIEVLIFGVDEFSEAFNTLGREGKKAILLFSSIHDAFKAFNSGFKYLALNIGNVYNDSGKQCSSSICLTDGDFEEISLLSEAGVTVELRCVPRDKPVNFKEIQKRFNA